MKFTDAELRAFAMEILKAKHELSELEPAAALKIFADIFEELKAVADQGKWLY